MISTHDIKCFINECEPREFYDILKMIEEELHEGYHHTLASQICEVKNKYGARINLFKTGQFFHMEQSGCIIKLLEDRLDDCVSYTKAVVVKITDVEKAASNRSAKVGVVDYWNPDLGKYINELEFDAL